MVGKKEKERVLGWEGGGELGIPFPSFFFVQILFLNLLLFLILSPIGEFHFPSENKEIPARITPSAISRHQVSATELLEEPDKILLQ